MDIKSASKAHTSEHKFDDRILTTEYYEPSLLTMPPTVAPSTVSGNANCSTTTPGDSNCNSASSTTKTKLGSGNNNNNGPNRVNSPGSIIQYSCSSSTAAGFLPSPLGTGLSTMTANGSGNCPNGSISKSESSGGKLLGLSDEHGSFYECSNGNSTSSSGSSSSRTASFNRLHGSEEHGISGANGRRMSASSGGYSRDPIDGGNIVGSARGRQRDRQHYRNGPYSNMADR